MKLSTIFLLISFCLFSNFLAAQESLLGIWKTIDDETGEAKSHIEIYEDNGSFDGKIVKLLRDDTASICASCKGTKKDQPLIGMVIMEDLTKHKNYWANGSIMDPENGKIYKCKVSMENNTKLKVRGYIGIEALGRNQFWSRVE